MKPSFSMMGGDQSLYGHGNCYLFVYIFLMGEIASFLHVYNTMAMGIL
jgi:hypothetical protein